MIEQRSLVRLRTRLDATYAVLPDGQAQRTLTRDVGAGGACLIADKPLPLGTQVQVALELPGREQPVNAIAEVVRSAEFEMTGKTDRRRSAEISLRMVEIAPQDVEVLSRFVAAGLQAGAA